MNAFVATLKKCGYCNEDWPDGPYCVNDRMLKRVSSYVCPKCQHVWLVYPNDKATQ